MIINFFFKSLNKKDKINSLKINIIINNIVKVKGNNNPDFLNSKDDFRRGNKRKKRFYDRENNNKNGKIQIAKPDKYYEERKKLKS